MVKSVREECDGFFPVVDDYGEIKLSFGRNWVLDQEKGIYIPHLEDTISTLGRYLLPHPMQVYLRDSDAFRQEYGRDTFFVFHYPLSPRNVKRYISHHLEIEQWFQDKDQRQAPHRTITADEMFRQFMELYGPQPTSIRSNYQGYTQLTGRRDILQRVMDYTKSGANRFARFMDLLTGEPDDERTAGKVIICDLLKRPKVLYLARNTSSTTL